MSTPLSRQIRSTLEGTPILPLTEVLLLVDQFVSECSLSAEPEVLLSQFEEELQTIHHQVVGHSSLFQMEVFLAVLYHLRVVLSPNSIITTWFDLVLRPALREAKLPTAASNHAKGLIISALSKENPDLPEKVRDFRCRLLDFYLLDTYNDCSGEDVLEWAGLDRLQRGKSSRWKENLEDILLRFGMEQPQDLLAEILNSFSTPSFRLQLLIFLNVFTSAQSFPHVAAVLAKHPLISCLLTSLLVDNSSTACTIGLTLLVKLLPLFAVEASEQLKSMLPRLFALLARILCWKEKPRLFSQRESESVGDADLEQEVEVRLDPTFTIRPDLNWQRLERTFGAVPSLIPSPRQLFTILYYLFPGNMIMFLRSPISHLIKHGAECPYLATWAELLDDSEIRSKSEELLRSHICHISVLWRGHADELAQPAFWAQYDLARIVAESKMLDVVNAALGMREKMSSELARVTVPADQAEAEGRQSSPTADTVLSENSTHEPTLARTSSIGSVSDSTEFASSPITAPIRLSTGRPHISLQDMITTSIVLKSDLDFEVIYPTSAGLSSLFPRTVSLPVRHGPQPRANDGMSDEVSQAISLLQRDVLLLRNELNLELWLSRENVKHIGRLYQDRVLSKNAETERQGLYNKLRNYRSQVVSLERELREHKEQASSAKSKYSDWNFELGQKLRALREEKKSWIKEAAALRTAEKEAQARFVAQGKLLEEAASNVFDLKTQIKAIQPKIDRVRDYERERDQHTKMQSLWGEDFRKFNEREEQMKLMRNQYKQMELRLETYQKTQGELEDKSRVSQQRIQALEAQLSLAKRAESVRQTSAAEIAAFAAEKSSSTKANKKLREENIDLKDQVEQLKARIEVLDGQVSGRKGLL